MRAVFVGTSLFLGLLIHLIFGRVLTLFQMGPDVLFLFVVAHAFLLGPVWGMTLGFFGGLMADSVGISLFGLQGLLFTLAGYSCGQLKRRVDSERPLPQLVIAVIATLFYTGGLSLVQSMLEVQGHRVSIGFLFFKIIMNGILSTLIFWASERWVTLWRLEPDHL